MSSKLLVYGANGFQIPQEVPADVDEAYQGLIAAGYTQRLIRD